MSTVPRTAAAAANSSGRCRMLPSLQVVGRCGHPGSGSHLIRCPLRQLGNFPNCWRITETVVDSQRLGCAPSAGRGTLPALSVQQGAPSGTTIGSGGADDLAEAVDQVVDLVLGDDQRRGEPDGRP